jgi:hypothetical protein
MSRAVGLAKFKMIAIAFAPWGREIIASCDVNAAIAAHRAERSPNPPRSGCRSAGDRTKPSHGRCTSGSVTCIGNRHDVTSLSGALVVAALSPAKKTIYPNVRYIL